MEIIIEVGFGCFLLGFIAGRPNQQAHSCEVVSHDQPRRQPSAEDSGRRNETT